MSNSPGLIPLGRDVLDENGKMSQAWALWLKKQIAAGAFVIDGTNAEEQMTISQGLSSAKGASPADGNIYFSTDTGEIFISSGGVWKLESEALTGDITKPAGSSVTTLPNVNSSPGVWGNSTNIPIITTNAKGLITSVATVMVSGGGGGGGVSSVGVSGGTTGLTTVGSPITTSGTITLAGTLNILNGGTGATTAAAAYNALSPMTTKGDIEYESAAGVANRLAIGSTGQVLTVAGGVPTWAAAAGGGVTSVGVSGGTTGLTTTGGPITTSGTISLTGTLAIASGGTGATTAAAAMSALSPITSTGDLIYSSSGTTNSRLAIGSSAQVLTVAGGVPTWATPATAGVTSVSGAGGTTGLTLTGGPITSTGTLTLGGTLAIASGGTGTASPALIAGSNITITGTWPNQLITSSGGTGATLDGLFWMSV